MEIIQKYFPDLRKEQIGQFDALLPLYEEWNAKINVISRKDMDSFYERHVLHSLAIARLIQFNPGTKIMDLGTGGGFPGIPLAIMFPEVDFHLVDSIGKKILVVGEVVKELGLQNVRFEKRNAASVKGEFDFVVTRAVARIEKLLDLVEPKIYPSVSNTLPAGILALKGGDLSEEIKESGAMVKEYNISDYFSEEFFETKKILHISI